MTEVLYLFILNTALPIEMAMTLFAVSRELQSAFNNLTLLLGDHNSKARIQITYRNQKEWHALRHCAESMYSGEFKNYVFMKNIGNIQSLMRLAFILEYYDLVETLMYGRPMSRQVVTSLALDGRISLLNRFDIFKEKFWRNTLKHELRHFDRAYLPLKSTELFDEFGVWENMTKKQNFARILSGLSVSIQQSNVMVVNWILAKMDITFWQLPGGDVLTFGGGVRKWCNSDQAKQEDQAKQDLLDKVIDLAKKWDHPLGLQITKRLR